jgi:hypothetical protein
MNKRQLIAMWVGIGLLVLTWTFPPIWHNGYGEGVPDSYPMQFVALSHRGVSWSRLALTNLSIIALSAGAILSFKSRS